MTRSIVLLSGGVGGARLARGFEHLDGVNMTVVVNVGDDESFYGVHVSPDIDTVMYTVAGVEGPQGWGRSGDTYVLMEHLTALGVDTRFRIGDADAALNMYRTMRLLAGDPLHDVIASLAETLGISCRVIPATNDRLRTQVQTEQEHWRSFQEYFVLRGHRDEVTDIRFNGSTVAEPAPGVVEAIRQADGVIIGPSNPPLSIWPVLAVRGIANAVAQAKRVVAISPLFDGRPLKGPTDTVMASLGLPPSNEGILAAYEGLLDDLVIDAGDGHERKDLTRQGVTVHIGNTRIAEQEAATEFAEWLMELL